MNYLTERIETLPGGGVVDGITYLFSAKIEVTSDIFPCRFDRSRGNSGMDVYTLKAGVYIQGNDADMARFLEANPQYAGYSPLPCSYNLYPLLLPNGEGVKTVWWEN